MAWTDFQGFQNDDEGEIFSFGRYISLISSLDTN